MNSKGSRIFNILGILCGVVTIFLAISAFGTGSEPDYASFGGDFYTYSYGATRAAARNVFELTKAAAYLLLSFGLFEIVFFGGKLCQPEAEMNVSNGETQDTAELPQAEMHAEQPEAFAERENSEAV